MSYCTSPYLFLFLPISVILYHVMPQKGRRVLLLIINYSFFWIISESLIIYLLFSTLSIHYFGLWLSFIQQKQETFLKTVLKEEKRHWKSIFKNKQRLILASAIMVHVGGLLILKYGSFFSINLNHLLDFLHAPFQIPVPSFLLPIGISFYTLQAVSYLVDIYRKKISADTNLLRLALYMSFFPQIMEGPICRYTDITSQLWSCKRISYQNLTFGIQRILFGIFKKVVIADRLNLVIKTVFTEYSQYDGGIMALAALFYTCQLYMEFSGTMDVVMGSGELFGIQLPENFRQPFFSKSISEFWSRWHITLGTWFRDYIFYPLSMSKILKRPTSFTRRHFGNYYGPELAGTIALFCVWFCNGLWHGAEWKYIFFGLYHFILIFGGNLIKPLSTWMTGKLHITSRSLPLTIVATIRTFLLVCIGELFFRATSLTDGLHMFKKMVTEFSFSSFLDGTLLHLGIDWKDYLIIAISLCIVLFISILRERHVPLRSTLAKQKLPIRWAAYYALILSILLFGAYGDGYVPVDPIYAGF